MAGFIVSASTGVMKPLLDKLATLMGEEFAKLKNLRREVEFISNELTTMKDALEGLANLDELDPQTKRWRDIVREMAYDIEDIIDDFMHRIGEKNKTDGFATKTARLLRKLRAGHQIAGRIKKIKKLVLETSARRQRYEFTIAPSSKVAIDPRVTTLYEKAANLVGMEGPKNELVNLLGDEEKQLKVVSIVGFGGLGKTTLANEVYRRLMSDFDCGAFVAVSQKSDIPKLIDSLLSGLGSRSSFHGCELNVLLNKVREYLQHQRYLIIIDDIWDKQAWDVIKCAFPENDLGSRVIVTTRIQDVAKACCPRGLEHILEMKPLSNEDSRKLFFERIFGSEEGCPLHLRDVSVEILKKCGGLPLAIVSISSMLASEEGSNQKERWEDVVNCLSSVTNLTLEGMRQILSLSYKDLPPHLRTCLLYLGMYPEDFIIDANYLTHQWIAEGFISNENGQDDAQKVAINYFNELVNRSLIQPINFDKRGSVTTCRVHDMMLDLILLKSAEENFFTIVEDPQDVAGLGYKIRRLSIRLKWNSATDGQTIWPAHIDMSHVRSVMFFGSSQNTPSLSVYKFLRVLSFYLDYGTVDLAGLCKLYHLRYLWISDNCSYLLPTQIRGLRYLEGLHLPTSSSIPSDIIYLPRLRYMNVGHETRLPDGIANMKSLRVLYVSALSLNTQDNIKELKELTNLRGLFVDYGWDSSDDIETRERHIKALSSSLGELCHLELLYLNVDCCIDGLMPLSPPSTAYRLEILCTSLSPWFSRVPKWMGGLHNLWRLQCHVRELLNDGVDILSQLPALTHLKIRILNDKNGMIVMSGKAFPALKYFDLNLRGASYLTFQPGALPKLKRLELEWTGENGEWEQNRVAPAGLKHLLALEDFSASLYGVHKSDETSIKSSLRSAINMHPGNPRFIFGKE